MAIMNNMPGGGGNEEFVELATTALGEQPTIEYGNNQVFMDSKVVPAGVSSSDRRVTSGFPMFMPAGTSLYVGSSRKKQFTEDTFVIFISRWVGSSGADAQGINNGLEYLPNSNSYGNANNHITLGYGQTTVDIVYPS